MNGWQLEAARQSHHDPKLTFSEEFNCNHSVGTTCLSLGL